MSNTLLQKERLHPLLQYKLIAMVVSKFDPLKPFPLLSQALKNDIEVIREMFKSQIPSTVYRLDMLLKDRTDVINDSEIQKALKSVVNQRYRSEEK